MTNGKCIYRKTVDYVSRMALEKDDFKGFSVIWEFRVTENWFEARIASMGLQKVNSYFWSSLFGPYSSLSLVISSNNFQNHCKKGLKGFQ